MIKMFVIGIIALVISMIVIGYGIASLLDYDDDGKINLVIGIFILIVSIVLIIGGTKSNSFQRRVKDIQSDYGDGIHRTITVTAEDGRTIYTYEGTVDLEINGTERKIKFEDEKRQQTDNYLRYSGHCDNYRKLSGGRFPKMGGASCNVKTARRSELCNYEHFNHFLWMIYKFFKLVQNTQITTL